MRWHWKPCIHTAWRKQHCGVCWVTISSQRRVAIPPVRLFVLPVLSRPDPGSMSVKKFLFPQFASGARWSSMMRHAEASMRWVRQKARETLVRLHEVGVQIKVISGDNPPTVAALAKQVRLAPEPNSTSGAD